MRYVGERVPLKWDLCLKCNKNRRQVFRLTFLFNSRGMLQEWGCKTENVWVIEIFCKSRSIVSKSFSGWVFVLDAWTRSLVFYSTTWDTIETILPRGHSNCGASQDVHVHTCYHIVVIAVWVLEVDVWGAGAKMVLEVSLSCFIYHPRRNLCSVFSNPSGPTAVVVFIVQQTPVLTKKVISNCFYSCHIKSHWPTLM